MDNKKRVYTFGNGQAEGNAQMREILGGKGANLAEMNLVGVPVPPGFTIITDVCNEYYQVGQEKIVEILDQYNKALEEMQERDLSITCDFVAMSAHLLYIKSKMLLPKTSCTRHSRFAQVNSTAPFIATF